MGQVKKISEDEKEEVLEEAPVETIRRMNPGKFIPTGAELAKLVKEMDKE